MKIRSILVLCALVTVILFINPVNAQSNQVTNNVSLRYLNVQLTYPSQALPGQSVTVNVQAKAKGSFQLSSLMLHVYAADSPNLNLRELTSTTVAQNLEMASGTQISKAIQVAVPADVPRSSLIARVSENITLTVFIVYINGNPSVQAAPYNTATQDEAISTLTYIAATTPEYMALQSQYQTLQTQHQQLLRGLNQSLAQNVKLQTAINQQNATIRELKEQLNQQLTYANRRVETYQGLALGFGILTVFFCSLYVHQRRKQQSIAPLVQSIPAATPQPKQKTHEGDSKQKLRLRRISVAAIAILLILISGWMIAGYYYGSQATAQPQSTTTHTSTTASGQSTQTSATTTSQAGHTSTSATRTSQTSTITNHSSQPPHT